MNKEIKQGYKQTKVGIIPEDWEVVKLGNICKFYKGKGISKENLSEEGIPCIRYGELYTTYNEKIDNVFSKTNVDIKELFLSKSNDIIIPASGETAIDIATASCVLHDNIALSGDLNVIRTKENGIFLSYYLNVVAKHRIASIAQGVSVVHLYSSQLENLFLSLPPIKEQEKIAEILTTWDEAITKQEELIKAKELQKKGLMQKLLSGEVRFNGFSDKWEDIRLGKYIKEISKKNKENIDLVLSVTNKHGFIAQKDYFDKEVASKNTSNYKIVKRGNFAYNPSRINVGSLGLLEEYEIGILSPMYVIFECLKGLNKEYLNYWLNTHNFIGNLYKFLSGSVRDSLAFNDMKLMKIKLPVLKEQEKIVEVLSLVDKEIDLLKKELEELKLQKKALMQKLLTGQVRVKV